MRETEREAQRELSPLYHAGEAIEKRSVDNISHHVKRSAENGWATINCHRRHQRRRRKAEASGLYDIGKVSVQMELAQSADALSIHDYEEIMSNVIKGHDYLSQTDTEIAQIAARIAQDIHERWDGLGFPQS